jgi:hypothetical protein
MRTILLATVAVLAIGSAEAPAQVVVSCDQVTGVCAGRVRTVSESTVFWNNGTTSQASVVTIQENIPKQKEWVTMEGIGLLACVVAGIGFVFVTICGIIWLIDWPRAVEKRLNALELAVKDAKGPSAEEIKAIMNALPGVDEADARKAVEAYLAV